MQRCQKNKLDISDRALPGSRYLLGNIFKAKAIKSPTFDQKSI
jgi:hypothetical protein